MFDPKCFFSVHGFPPNSETGKREGKRKRSRSITGSDSGKGASSETGGGWNQNIAQPVETSTRTLVSRFSNFSRGLCSEEWREAEAKEDFSMEPLNLRQNALPSGIHKSECQEREPSDSHPDCQRNIAKIHLPVSIFQKFTQGCLKHLEGTIRHQKPTTSLCQIILSTI